MIATPLLSFANYTKTVSICDTIAADGKAHIQRQYIPTQSSKSDDNDKPVTNVPVHHLTINYTMPEGETLSDIQIYNEVYGDILRYEAQEPGVYELDWPEGTWDICLTFNEWNDNFYKAFVIRENVVIDKDMSLTFDRAEATNIIDFSPIMHSGDEPKLAYIAEDGTVDETGVNCSREAGFIYLGRKGWGGLQKFNFQIGVEHAGIVIPNKRYYINPVSSNYYVAGNTLFTKKDPESDPFDLWVYTANLDKSVTITNSVNDYHFFEMKVPQTPAANGRTLKKYICSFDGGGIVLDGNGEYSEELGSTICDHKKMIDKVYVGTNANCEYKPVAYFYFETKDCEDESGTLNGVRSDKVYFNGDKFEFVRCHNRYGNYAMQKLPGGELASPYPGIQEYFFTSDEQMPDPVNNAPFLCSVMQINKFNDNDFYVPMSYYIGQYGEYRMSDWQLADVKVAVDGKEEKGLTLLDLEYNNYLSPYFAAEEPCKEMKITAVNENIEIDGVAGSNVAEIKILNGEDKCPPSVQMLAFRDKESGLRTHNFTAENGQLQFSAADLNWVSEDTGFWFALETPEVKAEYAPHGSETFVPLNVTEHPDRFYTPCFGAYYTAELNEVATTGWQDLRLTITDATGNSQTQTLSPAFNIQAPDGITTVTNDGNAVIWHDGVLYTGSNTPFDVFDLSGRKVASGHGPEAKLNLPAGVYIVDSHATITKIAVN